MNRAQKPYAIFSSIRTLGTSKVMSSPVTDLTSAELRAPQAAGGRYWEVSWSADGEKIWFRSGTELSLSTESLVCAFLFHHLAEEVTFNGDADCDADFLANLPKIKVIAQRYWGFKGPVPRLQLTAENHLPAAIKGMFFTGGVDSFFTLKRNQAELGCLINIHGFDIDIDDKRRFQASADGIVQVGRLLGLDTIFVETNLRRNPAFNMLGWPKTHIAALASVAHLLVGSVGVVRVAGSDVLPPHGSHPDLDGLWSSRTVRLLNDEYGVTRFSKIQEIVHWEPAQKFLKVCWENLSEDLNCGKCEKCVRTQVSIVAAGGNLSRFKTFPERDLPAAIQDLPLVSPYLVKQWKELAQQLDEPRLHSAITDLLARSPAPAKMKKVAVRRLIDRIRGRG